MIYVAIAAIIVLLYVLIRVYFLKKEIKSAARQLSELNKNVTEKKRIITLWQTISYE